MAARVTALLVVTIVAATLIAGLIVGAQRDTLEGPVDVILLNGKVFTGSGNKTAEAIAIRGNQILRVGTNREIKRLRRRQTTVIDAHGGSVLPGFNDAHLRFIEGGLTLDTVDLSGAATLADIEHAIQAFADANPDRRWIQGHGWSAQAFPPGLPTKALLDELVPDRPAQMVADDERAVWVNSKALEIAGITARTPSPKNGVIVKDPQTGEPTGMLKDAAMGLITGWVPPTTHDDRVRALRAAIREAHRVGITSVQETVGSAEDLDVYDEVRRTGDLQVRVYAALPAAPTLDEVSADRLGEILKKYPDDPLLKAGAIEFTTTPVATDAHPAEKKPARKNTRGRAARPAPAENLNQAVALLDKRGWQVLVRPTDDHGLHSALDAFDSALRNNPAPARGRRHRVEDLASAELADLTRLETLGLVAAVQPFAVPTDSVPSMHPPAVDGGAETVSSGAIARRVIDGGGKVTFGSDWPTSALDPLLGIKSAVDGHTGEATDNERDESDGSFTIARAIDAYTATAAWASFDEERKGTLAPGMLADIVILSTDVLALSPERLLDASIIVTIFDGKVVYTRETSESD